MIDGADFESALESVVFLADGLVRSYYGGDGDAERWLADLRAACVRLDELEQASRPVPKAGKR